MVTSRCRKGPNQFFDIAGGMENDMEDKSQLVPLEIPDNFKLNSRSVNVLINLFFNGPLSHGFQNRTGLGGQTVKTRIRDEKQFFKPKKLDFLLIP